LEGRGHIFGKELKNYYFKKSRHFRTSKKKGKRKKERQKVKKAKKEKENKEKIMIFYFLVFIMSFLSCSGDVREAIDKNMRDLFYLEADGTAHPHVWFASHTQQGDSEAIS
jgi:hypothetical protein